MPFVEPDWEEFDLGILERFSYDWTQSLIIQQGDPTITSLTLYPDTITAVVADPAVSITVVATYDTGIQANVTNACEFISNNMAAVHVSGGGVVNFADAFDGTITVTSDNGVTATIPYSVSALPVITVGGTTTETGEEIDPVPYVHTFADGEVIDATRMNDNFTSLANKFGNISNNDLSMSARISASKIAGLQEASEVRVLVSDWARGIGPMED
ncbi:MAG: hypothetical protein CMJ20_06900 [Phycisphaeraceae bacterium]|nr:hypothetical protein [Phycisphaeraceae bacterium]|tara:strand:+ start:729 stop:1370 length:642 start_codon:yes stop_codon:yes gene_type:complete